MEFYKSSASTGEDNHYHVIMRYEVMEPQIDPETGQPAVDPESGQPLPPVPRWHYECGVERGHEHEIVEMEDGSFQLAAYIGESGLPHGHMSVEPCKNKFPKRPEKEDEEVVHRVYQLHEAAYRHDKKSLEKGLEADRFYKGDQWERGTRSKLESEGRACLTINVVQKVIDDLVGYQRQQRSDIRFQPVGDTDQGVCDILNTAVKVILEQGKYQFRESKLVEDFAITGRANLNLGLSVQDDIRGDIKIDVFDLNQVFYGPHRELDGSDIEYLSKSQMWSLSKLKAKYKKKVGEIEDTHSFMKDNLSEADLSSDIDGDINYGLSIPVYSGGSFNFDVIRKEIKVIEVEEKVWIPVIVFYNAATDETYSSFGWKEKEVKQIETMPNMYIVEQEVQKLRVTKVAGNVLLSDDYVADRPGDDFSVFPIYCKKRGNDFWGIVESVKDAQREFNKRLSQAIDSMNFALNHLYVYDETTFETEKDRLDFLEKATKPGAVVRVTNSDRGIKVLQTSKFPSAEIGTGEAYEARIYSLAGIDAMQHAGANTSAQAILQAEKSKVTGREFIFRNLFEAKKRLAKNIVAYIKEFYSAERIYEMVADRNAKEPVEVNGNPFDQLTRESIIQLIDKEDLTKVDVVIDEAMWTPTHRLATFSALSEMMGKGAPIPFEVLIPIMDAPESYKMQIQDAIMRQQQAQSESSQATAQAEVEKTLIANGIITQPIAEKYQIPLPGGNVPPGAEGQQPQ